MKKKKAGITLIIIGALLAFVVFTALQALFSADKDLSFRLGGLQFLVMFAGLICFVIGLCLYLPNRVAGVEGAAGGSSGKWRKWLVRIAVFYAMTFVFMIGITLFISGLTGTNVFLIIGGFAVCLIVFLFAPKIARFSKKGKMILRTVLPLALIAFSVFGLLQNAANREALRVLNERFSNFRTQNSTHASATEPFNGKFIYYDENSGQFDLSSHGASRHWSRNADEITVIICHRKNTAHVGSYYPKGGGKKTGEAYRTDYTLTVYDALSGRQLYRETFRGQQPPQTYSGGNFTGSTDLTTQRVHDYIDRLFTE